MRIVKSSNATILVSDAFPFPDAPDIETASEGYEARFAGPTGQWFIDVQTRALLSTIKDTQLAIGREDLTILDVGGGHAQTAIPLIEGGHKVTVVGSSQECSRKLDSYIASGTCSFAVSKVFELPFPDQSFDVVISFRLLSHVGRWPALISELCRVAKHSVIIDFPPRVSFNALMPVLFKTKRKLEGNTRQYLVFSRSQVRKEFNKSGFELTHSIPQYFVPMVVHRKIKNPAISSFVEGAFKLVGLSLLFGSPIVAGFSRP